MTSKLYLGSSGKNTRKGLVKQVELSINTTVDNEIEICLSPNEQRIYMTHLDTWKRKKSKKIGSDFKQNTGKKYYKSENPRLTLKRKDMSGSKTLLAHTPSKVKLTTE